MKKNSISILAEMYDCEDFEVSSIFDDDVLAQFEAEYTDIDEVDEDCCGFTAEMVVVRRKPVNGRLYNLVEMVDLERFMESSGIEDVSEALEAIGHANAILEDNSGFAIVVDPIEEVFEIIKEAKCSSNKSVKKNKVKAIDKATQKIKDLKKKGIKIFRKKKTSKKKKKK